MYGELTAEQFEKYKQKLHNKIHWLLLYKEDNNEILDAYFTTVLTQITTLHKILNKDIEVLDLMIDLQMAYDEYLKPDCDFKLYRKLILDAHNLIDKLGEE